MASSSGSGTLPGNTITNPKEDLKVKTPSSQSTTHVQPSVTQSETPVSEPVVALVSAPMPNLKPSIPYPSRNDNERRSLIRNKEKLREMTRTSMNEHCSAVILNKSPKKLRDPDKFLIPCEFPGMDECLALAYLGANINLMPLSVWKELSLPELTPTCMTLEIADRSVSKLIGIAKDVLVKVGDANREVPVNETFHEQTDEELTEKELKQVLILEFKRKSLSCFMNGKGLLLLMGNRLSLTIMISQQYIYVAGSKTRPSMLNKENYVPWSSRLLFYAKSTPNRKFIYNSIINGPYVRRMIPEPGDANREVPVNETFHEQTGEELTEKELKQNVGNQNGYNEVQNVRNQVVQNTVQNPGVQNVRNQNGLIVILGIANQNSNGNGNFVATLVEGNAIRNNGNQIRCYNFKGFGHLARNCSVGPKRRDAAYLHTRLLIAQKKEAGIQLQAEEFDLMAASGDLDKIEEFNANCILMANLQQVSTSGTQTDNAPVYDSDGSTEKLENENVELDFQVLNYAKENAHLMTIYKNLFDSISVIRTQAKTIIGSLQNKLHDTIYENAQLRSQLFDRVFEQKDTTKGTSVNTQFIKQSILGKPPSSSESKLYSVTPFPKSKGLPKIDETHALSKPVTSNSVPTLQESKFMKNDNVIAVGMFRIKLFKTYREENYVPNKPIKVSVRTNSITVSQPHALIKKGVNSNSNGLSSTRVDNTAKTRRLQPRSNIKNDRAPLRLRVLATRIKTNLKLLINFIWKFLGTVHFGNDDVAVVLENLNKMESWNEEIGQVTPSSHEFVCPMRVENINGKRYIMVIVDDYSHYMWVRFLRSKDEAPKEIKTFLKKITVLLQAPVIIKTLTKWSRGTKRSDLHHSPSIDKTPYELINGKKQISHCYMYPKLSVIARMTARTLGNLVQKVTLAFSLVILLFPVLTGLKPGLQSMTSGQISSGLDLTYASSTITTQQPTERELDLLFEAMYDDYIGGQPSAATRTAPAVQAPQVFQTPTITTTAVTAPTPTNSSSQGTNITNNSPDVDELETLQQHV
nr:reverse transcriptase domain-containing protein [Tanacetum cinerariifolium]